MAFTARQLIIRAYNLSGIVSKEFQTVSGLQLKEGVDLLNDVLAVATISPSMVPYATKYSFNAVTGQEKYNIPGLVSAETFTYYLDNVRMSSRAIYRNQYFGSMKVDVNSLPFAHHFENAINGSDLYLYFNPDKNYPLEVVGKFGFNTVADENSDLSTMFDAQYLTYLRYALTRMICEEYTKSTPPFVAMSLKSLELKLKNKNNKDYSLKKVSFNPANQTGIWGQANIGHGWVI